MYHELGTAPNNSDVPVGNSAFIVDKGKNMEVDFEMVSLGSFKFHIKNQSCINSDDNIKIYYEGAQFEDEPSRVNDVLTELNGCVDALSDINHVHPIGYRYYSWVVNKNGVSQTFSDSIYIESDQVKVFEIFY